MKIIAIAAMDEARVIGVKGGLPWHYPEDMKRFSALTKGHIVLMGRKTYESLPDKYRPLPGRRNVVISRTLSALPGAEVFSSISECRAVLEKEEISSPQAYTVWIIGGEQIYRETLPWWNEVSLTRIPGTHEGDAYFPEFEKRFILQSCKEGTEGVRFEEYLRNV